MKEVTIINKKAKFEYLFHDKYEAGVQLAGTEVKSVRLGQVNMVDAFCYLHNGELFIKNLHISEYKEGTYNNHIAKRERKLLLNKKELKKIDRRVREKGVTIIPYKVYLNERGFVKVEIHTATGKKNHDKRDSIKDRDNKRDLERIRRS